MVFTTSRRVGGKESHRMSNEELIVQRRKTSSPTIEDDFTIDLDVDVDVDVDVEDEEPFDEPKSTPTAERRTTTTFSKTKNTATQNARADAEIDVLSWTGSDLDGGDGNKKNRGVEDKSKSVHSLVWSASELDDENGSNVDERDEFSMVRDQMEDREGAANNFRSVVNGSVDAVSKQKKSAREEQIGTHKPIDREGHSKSTVQFCVESDRTHSNNGTVRRPKKNASAQPGVDKTCHVTKKNDYDNMAIRTERSTDNEMAEDESNIYDGISAFSITPSVAPSVTASVTRRTRNTKNPKSPRTPRTARRMNLHDTETIAGETSVMTADIVAKMDATCSTRKGKRAKKQNATGRGQTESEGEEDLLDQFFENIESRTCNTPRRKEGEKDGLKRLINPFLNRLEEFDCIFEHLEEIACPEEDESKGGNHKARPSTPAAFAAATFTQLLDQIEKFDPGCVKSTATSCQTKCDIYGGQNVDEEDCDSEDEDMSKISVPENEEPNKNSAYDVLEKAYERAEKMVKDQKRTSLDKKDQRQNMKEQWYEAKANWKLRQSILAEMVRQNTAKAAETTTKYMDTIVSSCHPSVPSEATDQEKDDKKKSQKDSKQSFARGSNKDHNSVTDVYHDAASIDDSDFFSMMSPSEHSNIHSKHGGFRSNLLSPSEHSNIHSSRRNTRSTAFDALSEDEISATYMQYDNASDVLSDGPSDEAENEDNENFEAAIGVSNGPLAAITEEAESAASGSSSNRKSKQKGNSVRQPTIRRWAYPAPTYYNEKSNGSRGTEMASNPKEWIEMWKNTVDSVSGKILDRAQCASASINFADSTSFEDDNKSSAVAKTNPARDSKRPSVSHRMKQQNSIVEDEEYSVSVILGAETDVSDDLSGFETAANEMDFEQDERPPMLRLMKSRTGSRSCGSQEDNRDGSKCNKSASKSGSVHSRLSTEVPEGYTLADSIRHSSLSDDNNEADRTRMLKEPRGNKLKTDPSSHVRQGGSLPQPAPRKPDPECKQKDERIRSPRSSETNETSDMTTVSASSSDVVVTQVADSTHSNRLVGIGAESPEGNEFVNDVESSETLPTKKPAFDDDDGDKATVFSYSTSSTGSTEFRDCYQDAIPSMSTMGTVLEDETSSLLAQKSARKEITLKKINGTFLLASDANIVKSMALLSVSAAVLKSTRYNNVGVDSEVFEMESVPSTSSYTQEEVVLDSIFEETPELDNVQSSKITESEESPQILNANDDILEESIVEEATKTFLKESLNEDESNEILETLHEETVTEDSDGDSINLQLEHKEVNGDMDDRMLEQNSPIVQISKKVISESLNQHDSPNQLSSSFEGYNSIEDINFNKHLKNAFEEAVEGKEINSDELILESLQQQESVKEQERIRLKSSEHQRSVQPEAFLEEQPSDEPIDLKESLEGEEGSLMFMQTLKPKYVGDEQIASDPSTLDGLVMANDEVKSTSRTKKISSKLREPRSIEDRRRRRLRQRRKFEKILRGEDDSSLMSSSTVSGGSSRHDDSGSQQEEGLEKNDGDREPLISASFDTGFGPVRVIEGESLY